MTKVNNKQDEADSCRLENAYHYQLTGTYKSNITLSSVTFTGFYEPAEM